MSEMTMWYCQPGETQLFEPTQTGVYACRVPDAEMGPPFCKDVFLLWIEGCWNYLGSAARYRGDVLGFVGPIPRTKQ